MTNQEIREIAVQQSAAELGCAPADFSRRENVIVPAVRTPGARRYLSLPYPAYMVSYGSNIVASVMPETEPVIRDYLAKYDTRFCFSQPNIHILHAALRPMGYGVCAASEYWLPDVNTLRPLPCKYETRILTQADFAELYLPEWSNALCKKRAELDVLGVGAYENETLVGVAGCSADCDTMYQIGIDVLPEYRRQGIAAALTSQLAAEILKRGKVPFYCCAWCNLPSARNAVRAGFRPAWTETDVRDLDYIAQMNQERSGC